jgi:nucleoside-diphosphate-sugar epimerase
MRSLLCLLLICASFSAGATARSVLVTGATGRTGSLIYKQLQASGGVSVRALVRHRDDARTKLGCTACDESEVRGGTGR